MISVTTKTIDIILGNLYIGPIQVIGDILMALSLNQIKVIYKQDVKGQTLQMGEKVFKKILSSVTSNNLYLIRF